MPFGSNTHKNRWLIVVLSVALLPLTVFATATEQRLANVKDEFSQLWHSAAETTKRRATLEQALAQFDTKVAMAKQDLAKAADQRKAIRERINEHRAFIEALQNQMQAAQEAKAFYDAVALTQKDDFGEFLRYMTSRNIAVEEAGPAGGGDILKQILRGSLGDSVDDALAVDAVLQARARFLGQARVLVTESDRIEERLKEVALEYEAELRLLENEHKNVGSLVDAKSAFIDNSWKEKKLTEQELASVALEAGEANARISEMQESLQKINAELKEKTMKKANDELVVLQAKEKELMDKRSLIVRKDEAMQMLEDNELRAFQVAMNAKNSDKKLYKRIEEKKLERENKNDELRALQSASGASVEQIAATQAEIALLDQVITLMQDGIPLPEAEAYAYAKLQAVDATAQRAALAKEIAAFGPDIAKATRAVSDKLVEIAEAEKQFDLTDLPPLFQWPVSGTITAGYLDIAYEAVFRVRHRAIDIAVAQATPVRAISDGVVFAVKDGGMTGYSYALIGHRNGYASLYGHLSTFFVKKGDIVSTGQMIGLSGGKPGTRGAGYMTTGAHLHLEVTKDGAHINPMSVLGSK